MVASQGDISGQSDSRRNIIIVVALIALLAIAGLFYLLMRAGRSGGSSPATRLEGAIRPGSPDWDRYSKLIPLDAPEADEAGRALGDIVMTLHSTVRNFTGRTINGLEIRAAVVDHQGKPVKERYVVVGPTREPELAPNKTLPVNVVLDGMTEKDDRANIKMEVTGFKFK
jgi:hypothetical protein